MPKFEHQMPLRSVSKIVLQEAPQFMCIKLLIQIRGGTNGKGFFKNAKNSACSAKRLFFAGRAQHFAQFAQIALNHGKLVEASARLFRQSPWADEPQALSAEWRKALRFSALQVLHVPIIL